jgi:hypothetical protein
VTFSRSTFFGDGAIQTLPSETPQGSRCIIVQVNENGVGALVARSYCRKKPAVTQRLSVFAIEVVLSDLELELEQERFQRERKGTARPERTI